MRIKLIRFSFVLIIALISAVGGGFHYYTMNTPRETIRHFEAAINKKDLNEIRNCLVPEAQQRFNYFIDNKANIEGSIALLTKTMPFLSDQIVEKAIPNVRIEIVKEMVEGSVASLQVELILEENVISILMDIDMLKINDQWYINSIKSKYFYFWGRRGELLD